MNAFGVVAAVLRRGVTDSGLEALASAGCGAQLTSLTLACESQLNVTRQMAGSCSPPSLGLC